MRESLKEYSKEYLTTAEVAEYLRLKERKVYDLVRQGQIPCSRATGKLLFPRQHIDMWVLSHLEGDQAQRLPPPQVLAGSLDPLLEWAIRESGC
ncbi:helix-turn-helix domain-containing protein, partial [Halomonas sp. BC2]